MVVAFAVGATLIAAGARPRDLGLIALALGSVVLLLTVVEPYRMARLTGFLHPGADASGAGFQAAQAKIALGSGGIFGVGIGNGRAEGLLPARGPHRHDHGGDRRGAGAGRDPRRRRPLLDVRLRRAPGGEKSEGQLRQAPGRGPDLADPGPGDDQPLRGDGAGAADRRAAALRLLRQQQPAGDPVRGRADPQRRPRGHRGRGRVEPNRDAEQANRQVVAIRQETRRWQTARRRRRAHARPWKESIQRWQERSES